MPNVTATIAEDTEKILDGVVEAGLYTGRSDGIRNALRSYFESNSDLALEIAIHLYSHGEVDYITASRLAGVPIGEFRNEVTDEMETNDG